MKAVIAIVGVALLAGCATYPDESHPYYGSYPQYSLYGSYYEGYPYY